MSSESSTIFAVSSGSPPAAIGVIRISGPSAGLALRQLAGRSFTPRRASLAVLRDANGDTLDQALVLWFEGPATATGEDLAELHCHGGRAVLRAVTKALGEIDGLRPAEEGEFTRRAFANGRIDLAEAEGLADLLEAETELQRAAAVANVSSALSSKINEWREQVLRLSAQVEAALDFSDEDDVSDLPEGFTWNIEELSLGLGEWLERPKSEKLKEGFRVVLAGPPNAGKSTLFNALIESEAAITSPIAGTTRDVIERSVAIGGVPFTFVDTAGLRDDSDEEIEVIGIERARDELARADLILWLGVEGQGPEGAWEIGARTDAQDHVAKRSARHNCSAISGQGIEELKLDLVQAARSSLPRPGEAALNARQHARLREAFDALESARTQSDLLLIGEELRRARVAFDRLVGRATTEDMLDALFGRFCIGK
ncbi:tRNA modification GTPase [Erythrobacter sp. NAP1]|uniref:tRNA uridine-5-carboxymethylaminomethyl(34) synthesis GTPase MnmE n=1 Tax=Erythrobacter sp. NAP1 TaxID=237727 RepID=UPI0000687707|nr:tRNA uridine-5-carboxymethylaminomethyl(34) synthesis GTPase MnmE [Erythrobacter sp. NAP1]EAQ28516.1 tRNA modification GTPase [Erythrobacter sp. NAP1]